MANYWENIKNFISMVNSIEIKLNSKNQFKNYKN